MLRTDSIASETLTTVINDSTVQTYARPQTPYQVLRLLPKDATPAQQDSAIQAWFQPSEIHYSSEPDTLHLPGHGVGRNLKDVNLPQYYRESFFSNDSLFHPELEAGRYGVAGDPIPYVMANDNIITCLLLFCFVVTMMAFSFSRNLIVRNIKNFFYIPKTGTTQKTTTSEVQALFFFVCQTALLLSLLYFFYVKTYVADTFILSDEYLFIGIIFLIIIGYFCTKQILYTWVNLTFSDGKKNRQWHYTFLFLTAMEGGLLFPSVLLLTYFDAAPQTIINYFIIILILVKILAFYKCYVIFFRQNRLFLQIILYFCALEIIPMIALWGGLELMTNALKINF
jgi:hypothetical protein